jgi:hypothetical protein
LILRVTLLCRCSLRKPTTHTSSQP